MESSAPLTSVCPRTTKAGRALPAFEGPRSSWAGPALCDWVSGSGKGAQLWSQEPLRRPQPCQSLARWASVSTSGKRVHVCICVPGPPLQTTTNWVVEQQKCTISGFGRPEAQDQQQVGSPGGPRGGPCPRPLSTSGSFRHSLACRWPSSPCVCSCYFSFMHVYLWVQMSLFTRTPVLLDLDSLQWPHFNLVTSKDSRYLFRWRREAPNSIHVTASS